ncbi:MAG: hypothetical protein II467_04705 [Bacilli bacterium]|nr:hypothetical protein [Bacilli bacterium]
MKNRIKLGLCLVLSASALLASCGGGNANSSSASSSASESSQSQESSSKEGTSEASSKEGYSGEESSNESSGEESTSESSSEASSVDLSTWTDEELAALSEYVYGVDLPVYENRGENRLAYSEEVNRLVLMVDGEDQEDVDAYAANFTSWEGEYYADFSRYYYETTVTVEGETRYVGAEFGIAENEETKENFFFLAVYDPYVYEWPALELAALSEMGYYAIPKFDAEYYYFDATFSFLGVYQVTGYEVEDDISSGYCNLLNEDGFTVADELDEDGYYTATNGDTQVMFAYFAESQVFDVFVANAGEEETDQVEAIAGALFVYLLEDFTEIADYYDSMYDDYYAEFTLEDYSTEEKMEEGITYLANTLVEAFNFMVVTPTQAWEEDDYSGYEAYLYAGDSVMINIYNFLDEGEVIYAVEVYFDEEGGSGSGEEGEVTETDDGYIAKLDFTTMADQSEFSSAKVGEVTYAVTGGSNPAKYYENGNSLRVYYGATFSFSVSEGYQIDSIEFTIEEPGNKVLGYSSLTWTNGTANVEELDCVVTPTDGTLPVSFFIEGTKGHVRFTSISVTYSEIAE